MKNVASLTKGTAETEKRNLIRLSSVGELEEKINTPSVHKSTVTEILKQSIDVFAEKDTEWGKTKTIEMKIDTGDHLPIWYKHYWTHMLHDR